MGCDGRPRVVIMRRQRQRVHHADIQKRRRIPFLWVRQVETVYGRHLLLLFVFIGWQLPNFGTSTHRRLQSRPSRLTSSLARFETLTPDCLYGPLEQTADKK